MGQCSESLILVLRSQARYAKALVSRRVSRSSAEKLRMCRGVYNLSQLFVTYHSEMKLSTLKQRHDHVLGRHLLASILLRNAPCSLLVLNFFHGVGTPGSPILSDSLLFQLLFLM